MGLTYFKRFRMEIDLDGRDCSCGSLLPGYRLIPWSSRLLEEHAEAKYRSFRGEIDANVFPCFLQFDGCLRLMEEICRREGFLPSATWLLAYDELGVHEPQYCGTIQGMRDKRGFGAIQNVGVTPQHRGRGLGRQLIAATLSGFQSAGLRRAYLEVTAQNRDAVRLYERIGFRRVRTLYKAVEVAYS